MSTSEKLPQNKSILKSLKATLGIAGGYLAGLSVLALQKEVSAREALSAGQGEPITDEALQQLISELKDEKFDLATGNFNKLSFADAFEAARSEVGAGGVFLWNGNLYNTYSTGEWQALTDDQREYFTAEALEDYGSMQDIHQPEVEVHESSNAASSHVKVEETNSKPSAEANDESIYEELAFDETPEQPAESNHGPSINESTATQPTVEVVAEESPEQVEFQVPEFAEDSTIVSETFDPKVTPVLGETLEKFDGGSVVQVTVNGVSGEALDFKSDAQADVVLLDSNQNLKPDTIFFDTDGDGIQDAVTYDHNEDGLPDAVDPLGNTPDDNFDPNNPEASGDFDPDADVSSWKS